MRRRLPITTDTAEVIITWQQRREQLRPPSPATAWLFPSPLLRARQSRGHLTAHCVGRAFKAWVGQIGTIDCELLGPDGTPAPFDPSLITPYALRHSYAQRHADAGVPVDVLKELMDHVAVQPRWATTRSASNASSRPSARSGRWPSTPPATRPRSPTPRPTSGPRCRCRSATAPSRPTSKPAAAPARSASSAPAAASTAPTRPTCPPSNSTSPRLRADRETARAIGAADYVIDNLTAEIDAFTRVADTMRRRLAELAPEQRDEVEHASQILRRARAARRFPSSPPHLGTAG